MHRRDAAMIAARLAHGGWDWREPTV
jgi:hypothetical protein